MIQRPEKLFFLFKSVNSLNGVGPRIGNLLKKFLGDRLIDILFHLPVNIIDRTYSSNISLAEPGKIITLELTVGSHIIPKNKRLPYRVNCFDQSGKIDLVFFKSNQKYLKQILPCNKKCIVSGKIETYNGNKQITHPDRIGSIDQLNEIKTIEPVYPLSAGLTQKILNKLVKQITKNIPDLNEWHREEIIIKNSWTSWKESLQISHNPKNYLELKNNFFTRERLAFDELFANQIALSIYRKKIKESVSQGIIGDKSFIKKVIDNTGFKLTNSQFSAINEIISDLSSSSPMIRLLQGDVGSGKTIVSLISMLYVIYAGYQTAIMVPTSLLANQHFKNFLKLTHNLKINISLLTRLTNEKEKKKIHNNLKNGTIDLLVGTHSVFQKNITFKNLAFIVIDEQHRFGVKQRMALSNKSINLNTLFMTATPIPRTLSLTNYGNMEVSKITEKPINKAKIKTFAIPLSKLQSIYERVKYNIDIDLKAFWICPLIDESETLDISNVKKRYEELSKLLPKKNIGLIHGKVPQDDRDKTMKEFLDGDINLLVGTTVIEVGIDIPDANLIIIEHAERFGLAQLHQLRGRVGRGTKDSNCILLYDQPLTQNAHQRIDAMRKTEDGFEIAEKDLILRGPGEILGTRQSGLPDFKIVNLEDHMHLIELANKETNIVDKSDPLLKSIRGEHIRNLLHIFEKEDAIRYILSG
ncbi:MAG: ATP-dependent DNA helicase RecG [Alphaproteobacteria bacterium MarineAlpha2_Bin1]|nr:MAG: ATP-dependent DNA helicase RecG [Alphaproteobacteria bacterium MarineAlpha2_Bin1]